MRERYTYEIDAFEPAIDGPGGHWHSVVAGDDTFSREPAAIARGLLENWVIEHPHDLQGGERLQIAHPRRRPPAPLTYPRLRVRIFRGSTGSHDDDAAAVGYLGHDARDYAGQATGHLAAGHLVTGNDGEHLEGDRLRRLGASAARLAKDRRVSAGVGAGVVTALAVAAGFATRRTRRDRGAPASPRSRRRRGSLLTTTRPTKALGRRR